jgi:hypothetical protein
MFVLAGPDPVVFVPEKKVRRGSPAQVFSPGDRNRLFRGTEIADRDARARSKPASIDYRLTQKECIIPKMRFHRVAWLSPREFLIRSFRAPPFLFAANILLGLFWPEP